MRELPAWVAAPGLAPAWTAIRRRLETRGLTWRGLVTVGSLDREGRSALADLVGEDVRRGSVRIDLRRLDADLGARGLDLLDVVADRTGSPLRDRPGERATEQQRRASIISAARAGLGDANAGLGGPPAPSWVDAWLTGLPSSRKVTTQDAELAARVLRALVFDPDRPPVLARNDLAARLSSTRSAHSLDPQTVASTLVLRGLALRAGVDLPRGRLEQVRLWDAAGVVGDRVSSTCLTLGLSPADASGTDARMRAAAADGSPVHLTAWDLERTSLRLPAGTEVLVCENPRVLEALAEDRAGADATGSGSAAPIVCVCASGWPGAVTVGVLTRLREQGVLLRYHGDFDGPGLMIAEWVRARFEAEVFAMSADDYLAGVAAVGGAGTELSRLPERVSWDRRLVSVMRAHGIAVHEESVLSMLLERLRSARPAS